MELNKDDVLTMNVGISFKAGGIFKVGQLLAAIDSFLGEPHRYWFQEPGVSCEILKVEGGGWQKGKIQLRLEFIPDEPIQVKTSGFY